MSRASGLLLVGLVVALGAGCKNGSKPVVDALPDRALPDRAGERPTPDAPTGWVTAYQEGFDAADLGKPSWSADPVPDDGPFADGGAYFKQKGVKPPAAFRLTQSFGKDGWLTVESYTRVGATAYSGLVSVVADPAQPGGGNKVLRLASPEHTDATVIRSTQPLPERYRVSLRVGHASFGDGKSGLNGYTGGETAEPWSSASAVEENGFYWLAILDAVPRPHNNVWIHHHRKVVMDSDNHYPPWMEIWDGSSFLSSGEHPLMMFAVDGVGPGDEKTGEPFLSYSAGAWQPSGEIRAVDAYKDKTWYTVSVTREGDRFTLQVSGDFQHGGQKTYTAEIDAAARCVFHFNRKALEAGSPCVNSEHYTSPGADQDPIWPAGVAYPDYFMLGDPHSNYYEGEVYYDDLKLEVWK